MAAGIDRELETRNEMLQASPGRSLRGGELELAECRRRPGAGQQARLSTLQELHRVWALGKGRAALLYRRQTESVSLGQG